MRLFVYRILVGLPIVCGLVAAPAIAQETLSAENLPAGAVKTDGNKPLYLLVTIEDGKVVGVTPSSAKAANLTVTFSSRDQESTIVEIGSKIDSVLKVDLYISADDLTYRYSSSCPIIANGSDFEMWPHAVPWLAVTAVHAASSSEAVVCK